MSKRQLFPEKLWDLVNKPTSGIRWSTDGKKIEVERSQLEKFLLSKFRSHNFDSFIRQLHFYGFKKTGNSYYHDKFQRGQPEALATMKRKYSNTLSPMILKLADTSPSSSTSSPPPPLPPPLPPRPLSAPLKTTKTKSSSTLIDAAIQDKDSQDITIYTMKPATGDVVTFENVREDMVKAIMDDKSIQVQMPSISSDASLWPKTLVLDKYTYRNETILSAYFVYTGF